jgi:hypothetical protein
MGRGLWWPPISTTASIGAEFREPPRDFPSINTRIRRHLGGLDPEPKFRTIAALCQSEG